MSEPQGTVRWFGPASWGAPVCRLANRVAIPVGKFCLACHVRIEDNDRGLMLPFSRTESGQYPPVSTDDWIVTMEPHHLVCFLHSVGVHDLHVQPGPARQLTRGRAPDLREQNWSVLEIAEEYGRDPDEVMELLLRA